MKKTLFCIAATMLVIACNNASKQDVANSDTTAAPATSAETASTPKSIT